MCAAFVVHFGQWLWIGESIWHLSLLFQPHCSCSSERSSFDGWLAIHETGVSFQLTHSSTLSLQSLLPDFLGLCFEFHCHFSLNSFVAFTEHL